jgi:hypothetical protein
MRLFLGGGGGGGSREVFTREPLLFRYNPIVDCQAGTNGLDLTRRERLSTNSHPPSAGQASSTLLQFRS